MREGGGGWGMVASNDEKRDGGNGEERGVALLAYSSPSVLSR